VKQATNSDFVLHSEDSKAIKFSVLWGDHPDDLKSVICIIINKIVIWSIAGWGSMLGDGRSPAQLQMKPLDYFQFTWSF
jgi:hypothetical protein